MEGQNGETDQQVNPQLNCSIHSALKSVTEGASHEGVEGMSSPVVQGGTDKAQTAQDLGVGNNGNQVSQTRLGQIPKTDSRTGPDFLSRVALTENPIHMTPAQSRQERLATTLTKMESPSEVNEEELKTNLVLNHVQANADYILWNHNEIEKYKEDFMLANNELITKASEPGASQEAVFNRRDFALKTLASFERVMMDRIPVIRESLMKMAVLPEVPPRSLSPLRSPRSPRPTTSYPLYSSYASNPRTGAPY